MSQSRPYFRERLAEEMVDDVEKEKEGNEEENDKDEAEEVDEKMPVPQVR